MSSTVPDRLQHENIYSHKIAVFFTFSPLRRILLQGHCCSSHRPRHPERQPPSTVAALDTRTTPDGKHERSHQGLEYPLSCCDCDESVPPTRRKRSRVEEE